MAAGPVPEVRAAAELELRVLDAVRAGLLTREALRSEQLPRDVAVLVPRGLERLGREVDLVKEANES